MGLLLQFVKMMISNLNSTLEFHRKRFSFAKEKKNKPILLGLLRNLIQHFTCSEI